VPDAPTSAATLITPRSDEEDPRALARRIVAEVLERHGVAAPAAQRAAAVTPQVSPPSADEVPDAPVSDTSTAPERAGSPVGTAEVEDEAPASESARLARSIVADVLAERGLTRSGGVVDDVGPPSHPTADEADLADDLVDDGLLVAVADVAVHVPSAPADEPHDWTEPLFAPVDEDAAEPAAEQDGDEPAVGGDGAEPAAEQDGDEPAVGGDGAEPAADVEPYLDADPQLEAGSAVDAGAPEDAGRAVPGSVGAVVEPDVDLDDAEDAAETHEVEEAVVPPAQVATLPEPDAGAADAAVEELDPDDPAAIARRLVAETLAAAAEREAEADAEATAALTLDDATTPLEVVEEPTAPLPVEDEPTVATDVRTEPEDASTGQTDPAADGDPWGDEPWTEGPGEGFEDGPPPVPSHVHDEWRWSSTDGDAAIPGSEPSGAVAPELADADTGDGATPDADRRVDLAALPPPEVASASLLRSLASADPDPAPREGPRTGRWLLVTLLGAIGLALLLPLTIRALGTLLTLN
jgi:hypothetical protein